MSRDELFAQIPETHKTFEDYKSYADAGINDVFSKEKLKDVGHLQANYFKTVLFEAGPNGKFVEKQLPAQAQYAPVFTITALDYDKDGNEDILLCGNINHARLRFGKYDANYGVLMRGDGKGHFTYVNQQESGFHIWGDVRSVLSINNQLLFGINQQPVQAYKIR